MAGLVVDTDVVSLLFKQDSRAVTYELHQGAKLRFAKPEIISCPGPA